MSSDPRVLTNYLHVNTAWNFAIHRALRNFGDPNLLLSNTWRILLNSSHDVAVIQWCSLFGSNNRSNPTHWSRTPRPWIKDRRFFIEQILKPIGVPFDEWKTYHAQLLEYRNKNIAHIQVDDWYRNVPTFDIALNILFQSYRVLISDPDCEFNLEDEYEKMYRQTRETIVSSGFSE